MSLDKAFFVSPTLHSRKVTLPDGSEHNLHFAELPGTEFRKFQIAEQSDDENARAGAMAKLISASLREKTGKPAITYQQALTLKVGAMRALFGAVLEVNGNAGKGSPSEDRSGSTTS